MYTLVCVYTVACREPEGILPWKRNASGPLPMNTLSNKSVSPEVKGQQRVRCMTAAETKGPYMVRYIPSKTRV
jgi:hypothetical protein